MYAYSRPVLFWSIASLPAGLHNSLLTVFATLCILRAIDVHGWVVERVWLR